VHFSTSTGPACHMQSGIARLCPSCIKLEGIMDAGALSSIYWWQQVAVCGPAGKQTNKPWCWGSTGMCVKHSLSPCMQLSLGTLHLVQSACQGLGTCTPMDAAMAAWGQKLGKPTSHKCWGSTGMCVKHSLSPCSLHSLGRPAPCAICLPRVGVLHPHGCSHGSLGPKTWQTNKPQVLGQHWHVCEALPKPMEAAQLGLTCTLCNLLAKGWGLATPWVQPWQPGASRCANQQATSAGAALACV
jgi:hypothetical protein